MSKLYNDNVLWEETAGAALSLRSGINNADFHKTGFIKSLQVKKKIAGEDSLSGFRSKETFSQEDLISGRSMIKQVIIGVVCGAAVLTVGILLGHFGIAKSGTSAPSWLEDVAKDVDESLIEKFMSEVDNIQIQENLRSVSLLFKQCYKISPAPHLKSEEYSLIPLPFIQVFQRLNCHWSFIVHLPPQEPDKSAPYGYHSWRWGDCTDNA